ncbi:MAG TPA: F0F1 ATP synthase subunit A [Bacteriovoracaceae bacterium]|nr:F0F1 ATP synthase subunit A [Bacteriovoracaceae bacterium]
MMRLSTLLLALLAPTLAMASGYTFMSQLEHSLHIKQHIITFALVGSLFILVGFIYRAKVQNVRSAIVPDKGISFRNAFEALGQFIYNLCRNIMGEEEAKRYFTVIMLLFTFVFANNLIGLLPGFLPPTDNFNTTLALGLFVFLYYNYQGIRSQGIVGHIKHFMGPVWYLAILIFPIELISHTVRPLSLGLRLKGNMEGDHLVLSIFSGLVPYIVPIPFYVIGLFVCFMQAFVFTLLTMVYISLATAHHDHDAEHAHH